jgi:hypothetical protein
MMKEGFDVAQICKNGHLINEMSKGSPASNQKHCDLCGEPTLTACESCGAEIRGRYHVSGYIGYPDYNIPNYCINCGQAYPWTHAAIETARKLADELDNLNDKEREMLKDTIGDLVRDSSNAVLAESQFKKIMSKVGKDGYETMRSILTDVLSEAVRKTMFP